MLGKDKSTSVKYELRNLDEQNDLGCKDWLDTEETEERAMIQEIQEWIRNLA